MWQGFLFRNAIMISRFFPLIGIPISIMIFSCNFFTGTKISNRFDFIQTNTKILQFQITFSIQLLFQMLKCVQWKLNREFGICFRILFENPGFSQNVIESLIFLLKWHSSNGIQSAEMESSQRKHCSAASNRIRMIWAIP